MDTILLESLGLTHYEAIVYLTLSKIGSARTGSLLKESGLNTGKIYEILESLKRKGLVSETETDGVKQFSASPPDRIRDYITKKKEVIENEEKLVDSLIPEIEKLRESKLEASRVAVYTGFDGFKTAVSEATKYLKENDEVLAMGVTSSKRESFSRFWDEWTAKNITKKNRQRVLFSEKGSHFLNIKSSKFTHVKLLESITPTAIDIFGEDVVLILHYEDPIKVIFINDHTTAISFKSFFEELWKTAKS